MKTPRDNIKLLYLLSYLTQSWFWIPIWVLYYLRFTDYAGIGLLESIMIITVVVTEIPTGAIADLLGRKKTMMLAYACGFVGQLIFSIANSLSFLGLGIVIATVSDSLRSGTKESLVYDSLLVSGKKHTYQKVLGNISSINMMALAVASIVGGFMYSASPRLPFFMVTVMQGLALIVSLFLTEPAIDSEQFSFKTYIQQTKRGFQSLFASSLTRAGIILLIMMSMITLINGHSLIDLQLVALGWEEEQLGLLVALMFFVAAGFGQLSHRLTDRFGTWLTNTLVGVLIALSMMLVPALGVIVATSLVMARNGLLEIFGNSASEIINNHTPSKYRATTLSTYTMLANTPYIISAYGIGKLMDIYSVHSITAWLGVGLLLLSAFSLYWIMTQKNLAV